MNDIDGEVVVPKVHTRTKATNAVELKDTSREA